MLIISKSLDQITKKERRRLNYLTLRGSSLLRDDILKATKNLDKYQLFLTYIDDKIVGWSAAFPEILTTEWVEYDEAYRIYTYVQTVHRRKGVGKQLIKRASKWACRKVEMVRVFAWDSRSEKFYRSCIELPVQVDVEYAYG